MAQDRPDEATVHATCDNKGCDVPAVFTCERCGHRCCADHARHQTIERRVYRDEAGYQPVLERAPSHFEAYTLCVRCSTKPFEGKPAQPPSELP